MSVRKEQIVLLLSALLLGWMLWRMHAGGDVDTSRLRQAPSPTFESHPAPDPGLALASERRTSGDARELFAPPSDTRPLPPLVFEEPPRAALDGLRPPPLPEPAPALFGSLLRAPAALDEVPGLFGGAEELAAEGGLDEVDADELGDVVPTSQLDPDELRDRIASYKKLYDWVRLVDMRFGRIVNQDRFRLPEDQRPLRFVQVDPRTGEALAGGTPIELERERVREFGFAETVANEIERRRAQFGDPLPAAQYEEALAFADWCVEQRHESPRALAVAEEVLQRALAVANEDPAPRLGLARVYEAGFDFERAFRLYRELLDQNARDPRVLVRMGELEARFRMLERAEERFREALRFGRTSWYVHGPYGRFLLERGRDAEAAEQLRLANQYEPSGPLHKADRVRLRNDLGAALVGLGEVGEAQTWFGKALQAAADDQRALAGRAAAALLAARASDGGLDGSGPLDLTAVDEGLGFDLLLVRGVRATWAGEWQDALRDLTLAAEADPLRAWAAWRALSWVAERTGHPSDALRYADLAHENDPTDVWTLFQRGRLLAAGDDAEGALEAFRGALDRELDLADALAAMGELAWEAGRNEDAERYFERALEIDGGLDDVRALRGVNLLELSRVRDAEELFAEVLSRDLEHPLAALGRAWCAYREGDPDEAITRFRELDDARRALSEDDPYRDYARRQIERIGDHREKVLWTDTFERRDLRNDWVQEEPVGPRIALVDGEVRVEGTFSESGRTRLYRRIASADFVAFQARLAVRSGNARVGLFLALERFSRGVTEVQAEATLSRHRDGDVQTRFVRRGEDELPYEDRTAFDWPLGEEVVARLERAGEGNDTTITLLLDGVPVLVDHPAPALGRSTAELRVGVFVEGEAGRAAEVVVGEVEMVFRERR